MEQQEFEQTTSEQQVPQEPVDVVTVVLWMVQELQAQAWIKMGLWKDPVTDQMVTDLPQAKIAIDSVAALVEVVRPHLSDEQRREMERLLTDLRLNFVQRSSMG